MTWLDVNEQDERRLASFMTEVSRLPIRQPLPEAAHIWWKAQLLRRWDAERKVVAPLEFMQPVELLAGAACFGFLLYRVLPYLF
jgi:hypothetical protein